jgi:thiol-disulfide isomerase/thioredoxin
MNYIIIILIIAILFFIYTNFNLKENFTTDNTKKVLINMFLSKSCPHCITYLQEHKELENKIKNLYPNSEIKLIFSDVNRELFEENKIEYVPTCMININDNGFKKMNDRIEEEKIIKFIKEN